MTAVYGARQSAMMLKPFYGFFCFCLLLNGFHSVLLFVLLSRNQLEIVYKDSSSALKLNTNVSFHFDCD